MVEQAPYFRPYDPDLDPYNEENADPRLAPYPFERSARNNFEPEPAPLFLSDYDGEPDPSEFAPNLRNNRKAAISFRILAGVLAASAAALLVTLFSSDATRSLIVDAKASISAALQAQSASARPASAQLTARDMQLKDPARAPPPAAPATKLAMAPTREEITTAYQSALQSRAPAAAALAAAAPAVSEPVVAAPAAAEPAAAAPTVAAPPRQIDADELTTLLKRAKSSLAAGDIPVARLLLERAANVEPSAAFLLAETYDPDVLGTPDSRSITPDPAAARRWYQRAAQLGSTDAQQRLAQLQN
jgi:TPR repeat protein